MTIIAVNAAGTLTNPGTGLGLDAAQVGYATSIYVAGWRSG